MGSQHAPAHHQPWQPAGVWARSINLAGDHSALLTLHRRGSGISPGGWVLRGNDFDCVAQALRHGARVQAQPEGLLIDDCLLAIPRRQCSLRLVSRGPKSLFTLAAQHSAQPTGLYGPLRQAMSQPLALPLRAFCAGFAASLTGQTTDWSDWLGKGPGLTPSHDDMLVGMLLAARYFGASPAEDFFAASGALPALTTRVSVSYLQHAVRGCFASPLVHFALASGHPRRLSQATATLLELGHTSGADTLLGFWLGQTVIKGSL